MPKTWFWQAVVGGLVLIPGWLAVPFFQKNVGVRPEDFIVWYFLAMAFTPILLGGATAMPSPGTFMAITAIGIFVGVANVLAFRAVVNNPPNPGVPVSIFTGVSTVGVLFVAIALAAICPRYFDGASLDFRTLIGVLLIIIGMVLAAPH